MSKQQFTTVISKKGRWYLGTVPELPGANAQGRTRAEARRNLKEAVSLILDARKSLGINARRRTSIRNTQTRSVHK
jgi:predicted RNase H-like HicB family nuclease